MDVIYCNRCGKPNPNTNSYCRNCGINLTTVAALSDAEEDKNRDRSVNGTLKSSIVLLLTASLLFLTGYVIKQTFFIPEKTYLSAKAVSLKQDEKKPYDKYPETFVCPESHIRELQISDIENLSDADLRLCRNEIYARYGFPFGVKELREHFEKLPWYKRNEKYSTNDFSKIEKKNAKFIRDYEDERQTSGEEYVEDYGDGRYETGGSEKNDTYTKQNDIHLKPFDCIKLTPANDVEEKAFSIIDYAWRTQVKETKNLKNLPMELSAIQKSYEVQRIQAALQIASQSLQYGLEQLSLASGTSKLQIVLSQLRANCPM